MNNKENMENLLIYRYENEMISEFDDTLCIESELQLKDKSGNVFKVACTNIHLDELKAGILFSQGSTNIDSRSIKNTPCLEKISYSKLLSSFTNFCNASNLFKKTGSVHSGQLLDEDYNVIFFTEDMGRHNVIDKIIGYCILNDISLKGTTLMISSRMPLELIKKSYNAGIMKIASVSAPTKNAIVFAREHQIFLAGMFRDNRFNIYST